MPPLPRATRRHALRLLTGGALALAPALPPREAGAFRGWCRTDPIFRIGGQRLHLWVAVRCPSQREASRLSRGPIAVVLAVPVGVAAVRLDANPGFGDGFDVAIEDGLDLTPRDGAIPVRLWVEIPFAETVPAKTWLQQLEPGPVAVGHARGRTHERLAFVTPERGVRTWPRQPRGDAGDGRPLRSVEAAAPAAPRRPCVHPANDPIHIRGFFSASVRPA